MIKALLSIACLAALTITAPAHSRSANVALDASGTPAGFDDLAAARETLVDVYFGDEKVGEALAVTRPGAIRFKSPGALLKVLPKVIPAPEVAASLAAELPTHSDVACSDTNTGACGILTPSVAGIIYTEDRFRVDVFVNPKFLRASYVNARGYIPVPSASLALTSAIGVTASGTIGGPSLYNLQNRTIVGFGNSRVRANASYSPNLGLIIDDLVGEIERRDLRYSAGLFWAPGSDFIGQRRIIGAGIGTQFDTWIDQDGLRGTPLMLSLTQPARVDLLVDGRLISSNSYGAGNNELDTAALADGSYSVVLRIHATNGALREERRFFVKNAQIPPSGHPIFYAYGGLLAQTHKDHPINPSKTFFYQAGGARRLSNQVAVDVAAFGTQHKAIIQTGAWLIKGSARLRIGGLFSTSGDRGAQVQLTAGRRGPLNISFDLRRIWSRDGKPLIPLPNHVQTFEGYSSTGVQLASGSYTQATASIGMRVANGYLSFVGSYRKDRKLRADYSIGPSLSFPVLSRNHLQLAVDASVQRTRTSMAAFAGVRALFTGGPLSLLSTLGRRYESQPGAGRAVSRAVTNMTAEYSRQLDDATMLALEAGADRNIGNSTVHAGARAESRFGAIRGDVVHSFEGRGGTQYDISFQSGLAMGGHAYTWGGRNADQSAILVSIAGDAPRATFEVFINDVARGQVHAGRRLSLFLPGYRTYKVRLVPTAEAQAVSYDPAAREVTLYPGNVQSLVWRVDSYFTIFAQAVLPNGAPVSEALVQSAKGVAQTDRNGYFQLDVRNGDRLLIAKEGTPACNVTLSDIVATNDFASIGKVLCR